MASEVDSDLFDAVLNLEEDYYKVGHEEGVAAGRTAGRLEGRAFGIEKGFERYLALGLIKGRTKVWESRVSGSSPIKETSPRDGGSDISNPRYIKHLSLLQTLTSNPPIRNEEDDVEEVDDRIRRGRAKVKILENALGEGVDGDVLTKPLGGAEPEFEDFTHMGRKVSSKPKNDF